MSIENVTDRFMAMAGIDSEELPKWSALISYACDFVQSRCVTDDPDRDQRIRFEYDPGFFSEFPRHRNIRLFTGGDMSS